MLWDICTRPRSECRTSAPSRELATLSGGEQKRMVLEALLRGPDEVLLLDEPDNYLDVPGKRWLEERIPGSAKTVLFVSHDRELLARTATRIVTVEGGSTWIQAVGSVVPQARVDRHERLDECVVAGTTAGEDQAGDHYRNKAAYNSDMASRYHARRSDSNGSIRPARRKSARAIKTAQAVDRRTDGRPSVMCERLELTGLMRPFDSEFFFGERVGVLGSNGSGKSHFLRLLAPGRGRRRGPAHRGGQARGPVVPGHFSRNAERPELGRTPC